MSLNFKTVNLNSSTYPILTKEQISSVLSPVSIVLIEEEIVEPSDTGTVVESIQESVTSISEIGRDRSELGFDYSWQRRGFYDNTRQAIFRGTEITYNIFGNSYSVEEYTSWEERVFGARVSDLTLLLDMSYQSYINADNTEAATETTTVIEVINEAVDLLISLFIVENDSVNLEEFLTLLEDYNEEQKSSASSTISPSRYGAKVR